MRACAESGGGARFFGLGCWQLFHWQAKYKLSGSSLVNGQSEGRIIQGVSQSSQARWFGSRGGGFLGKIVSLDRIRGGYRSSECVSRINRTIPVTL